MKSNNREAIMGFCISLSFIFCGLLLRITPYYIDLDIIKWISQGLSYLFFLIGIPGAFLELSSWFENNGLKVFSYTSVLTLLVIFLQIDLLRVVENGNIIILLKVVILLLSIIITITTMFALGLTIGSGKKYRS